MPTSNTNKSGSSSAIPFLVVLYAGAFLGGFNENLLNMALVPIMGEYGIDSATSQWLVSGYMIVATIVVSCMAFLFRRVPLKVLFYSAVACTAAGSILGIASSSFAMLLCARLVQALGSGIFIPLMINTVLVVSPRNRIATFVAIGSCTITFGPALAPVVTGGLVSALGWHSVFLIPILASIVIALLGIPFVRNLQTVQESLDIPSVALSATLLTSLTYGLAELTINAVIAGVALIIAVASIALFAWRQVRCEHPLIDLAPLRMRSFWPTVILTTIAMMSSFSLSVMLPQYFEGALGMEAFAAGMVILVPVLANALCTIFAGRAMDTFGEWPLIPAGFAITLVGFVLASIVSSQQSVEAMFMAALVALIGIGMVFSPSQTSGLRTLPPELNPFGVALNTTFLQIAACIGPSLYMGILSSTQAAAATQGIPDALAVSEGFRIAMLVGAGIAAVGLAIAVPHSLAARKRITAQRQQAEHTPAASSVLGSIMNTEVYSLAPSIPVRKAMRSLIEHHVSGMPLVDDNGKLVGFVSDGDIMRFLADKHPAISGPYTFMETVNSQSVDERLHELLELPVSDIATDHVITISAGSSLKEACGLLAQYKLKKIPVTENGKVAGMLSRSDVMRYAMESAL